MDSIPRLNRRYRISEPLAQQSAFRDSATQVPGVIDVASLLALVAESDIHLFGASFHARQYPSPGGRGATYSVSQFRLHFDDLGFDGTDSYEDGRPIRGGGTSKGDIVVTKRIGVDRDQSSDGSLVYAQVIRPLVQELRVLSHPPIRDHPNIIDLLGLAWEKTVDWTGHCWPIVVLEYAGCGNMIDFFALKEIHADWMTKLHLSQDIVEGLAALHQAGIIHGDLKGENILIIRQPDGNFQAKLCDFGFALIKGDYGDQAAQVPVFGFTPSWAAPELRRGTISIDSAEKVDVYALGLLFAVIARNGLSPYAVNVSGKQICDILIYS